MTKTNNRREFLKLLAKGSTAGILGSMGQMTLINEALAAAPDFAGGDAEYKAMVCVFLKGGNDSVNMFIPTDTDAHDTYASLRGDLSIANNDLNLANNFVNGTLGKGVANPYHVNGTSQSAYTKGLYDLTHKGIGLGINGLMPEFAQLIEDNKASIIANMGNLVNPVTRQQVQDKTANLPLFLFAHNHQQREMQTGRADKLDDIGWAGRIADSWIGINNNSKFGLNMSYSGNDRMLIGESTSPLVLRAGTPPSFTGMTINTNRSHDDRRAIFKALSGIDRSPSSTSNLGLNKPSFDNTQPFRRLFGSIMGNSLNTFDELSTTWQNNDINYTTRGPYGEDLFANVDIADLGFTSPLRGNLIKQFESVAKMIHLGATGAFNEGAHQRQIFFVSMGGFDTHKDQLNSHPQLLREMSLGLWKFQKALEELGHAKKVITFSMSDFGRTVGTNGSGTDHAWGAHHFVMGGDGNNNSGNLNGGNLLGTIPDLALEGKDDFSTKGRLIPTTAQDQLNASICHWFGVDDQLISSIFPNLSNFTSTAGDPTSAYLNDLFIS